MVTNARVWLNDDGRYLYGLDLPDEVAQHSSIQQLHKLAKEFVVMCVHVLQAIKDRADQ